MSRIVAHLIVGAKHEPFLSAMLASIAPGIERIFVNENSGLGTDAPNLPALESSTLARDGKMVVARTTFESFASARNVCFDLDKDAAPGTWVVFIDADEVHFERFARIAAQLDKIPAGIGYVDGYTWHFYFSFDWYYSIERRMMFHRWTPAARWEGEVHERLTGVPEGRVVLPYVYPHYGHVTPFAEFARKWGQYTGLGAQSEQLSPEAAHAADFHGNYDAVEPVFAERFQHMLRFTGAHPAAARPFIAAQQGQREKQFAQIERLIRKHQGPGQRALNLAMKLNYEQRWRSRALTQARLGIR
jgi:hypothetical protein